MVKSDSLHWFGYRPTQRMLVDPHARWQHEAAVARYGMHGGWHTRMRMASAPQGSLGKWERASITRRLVRYWDLAELSALLPPECVALGGRKIRSHRRGLSVATILEACDPHPVHPWKPDPTVLRDILDMTTEEIETRANMKRLARLASRGV